jgi:hypothetical protein
MDIKRTAPYVMIVFTTVVAAASRIFLGSPELRTFSSGLEHTVGVLLNFSIVVGVIMQLLMHSRNISQRRPGMWGTSIVTLVVFLIFVAFALAWGGTGSTEYQGLYKGTLIPAHWAAEGFLIFLFFSATWRGYRARSVESLFMVILCVISLISAGPATRAILGETLQLNAIYSWLVGILATGVSRGILIATMIGSIAFMVRVLIGKQRLMGD